MFAPPASASSASAQIALERALHPGRPLGDRPRDVERARLEDRGVDLAQLLELGVEQDRVVDHELARVLGRLVEQVALRADARLHAHHDRLADRVDRRVRHLREELLEVRVEERLAVGEHGERRVVPHRADRLLGVPRERREDHVHVLLRVAERELALAQRLVPARAAARRSGRSASRTRSARRTSRPYGCRVGDLALDLLVLDDPARGRGRRGRACPAGAAPCGRRSPAARRARRSRRRARPSRRSSRTSGPGADRCDRASRRSRVRR